VSNLLTHSRLRTWRDCKRKHQLMYGEGWRPVAESDALSFGRLWHEGMAAWSRAEDELALDAALATVKGRAKDPYVQVVIEELLQGYEAKWSADRAKYDVLAVEQTFVIPHFNPESGATSRTWLLAGAVDGILRERATGRILLLERKTTSDEIIDSTASYWERLVLDGQVSQYYLGSEGLGYPAEGCLYDVVLKPRLRPYQATPEEKRRLKKDGTPYANVRLADETPEEYRLRVREALQSEPARYYERREVPRLQSDLRDYLQDAWMEGKTMREAERLGYAPRNPESCHRFGVCPFWEVCAHGVRPEERPDLFRHVEDVHPELDLTGVPA
jgi:PD-(D/E)XK nuclease superfamily